MQKKFVLSALAFSAFIIHILLFLQADHLWQYILVTVSAILFAGHFFISLKWSDAGVLDLEAREKAIRKVMDSSLDMICVVDEEGNFVEVSAACETILGYRPEELIGARMLDYVYPPDVEITRQTAQKVMSGINAIHFENRYVHKNGSSVWLAWSAGWREEDRVRYGVARDITELKKTQNAVRESEEKYRYIFQNNPFPMFIWDFETLQIVDCNEEALIKYGYSRSEFLSLTIKDIRPEEDSQVLEAAVETEEIYRNIPRREWRHRKKSGELMILVVTGHLIDFNGRKASLVMVNDETEKRKIEAEKEFEKRDKDALINSTEDLIWSVSRGFKLIAANNAFVKYFEVFTGQTIKTGDDLLLKDLFPGDFLDFWVDCYNHCLTGATFKKEKYNPANGARKESWREISFYPIKKDNEVEGIACHSQDITEAKAAAQKISESEAHLAEAQKLAKLGSWNFDFRADSLTWSEQLYEVFDTDKQTFVETHGSFIHLIDEADRERVLETSRQTQKTGEPFTVEYHITTRKGEKRVIKEHGYCELNAGGEVVRLFGTAQDVTDRYMAEQLIRENETKYRSFFENSMDGILLTVTDGKILDANPAACAIFGMTAEEIRVVGRYGLVDTNDPRAMKLLEERRKNGRAKGELTFIRKDGSRFPGELSSATFRDASGQERTSMIIRDVTERSKFESRLIQTRDELAQALTELRKIMDSSLDIVCTIDSDGRFVKVSAAAEVILGYTPGELEGSRYMDLVFPDDVAITGEVAGQIMQGHPVTMFENRYLHKNGSLVPLLWSATWDEKEKLMFCIAKDATEKKRLEKAFIAERKRFYDLFLKAPSAMGILRGPEHIYEYANPLYLATTGRKDVIGKTVREIFSNAEAKDFFALLDSIYQSGETFSGKEVLVQIDVEGNGKLVDIYSNFIYQPYKNAEGEIDGIFFFANDVTEQVLSRKMVEASEKKYRQIVETAQEGIWLVDETGITTFVNDKILEILKYEEDEMLGLHLSFFISDEHKDRILTLMQKKELGTSDESQFKCVAKSGKSIWVRMSSNPFFDDDGVYKGTLAMVTDISAAKQLEDERTQMVSEIVQRSNNLEQFAFVVSHNLRAPVANILGLAQILKSQRSEEDRSRSQEYLFKATENLDEILKDLGKILQLRSDHAEYKEPVLFEELVKGIESGFGNQIQEQGVQISIDFAHCKGITSVKSYVHSIFYNLISNAIKYRNPGQGVLIQIRSSVSANKLQLSFKDNGSGLDLKLHGKMIFTLYKRFHMHTEGKGMGLFMVKTQVETLGGNIRVESEPGRGTEFIVELPLQDL